MGGTKRHARFLILRSVSPYIVRGVSESPIGLRTLSCAGLQRGSSIHAWRTDRSPACGGLPEKTGRNHVEGYEMKQVYVAKNPADAHLLKGLLEGEDIQAIVRGEFLWGTRGEVPITPETCPTVWVINDSDYERAMEL